MRSCNTCCGNGELVVDWDRYLGGKFDESSVEDCPDCDGTGEIEDEEENMKPTLSERFLRSFHLIKPEAKFVGIVSWKPCYVRGQGMFWPTFRADYMGLRNTLTPVWDWARIRSLFRPEP